MNDQDKRDIEIAQSIVEHARHRQGIGNAVTLPTPRHALERIRHEARTLHARTVRESGSVPPPPPTPICPVCRNFRFVRRDLSPRHPDFGKSIPCPSCYARWMEASRAHEMAPRWQLSDADRAVARKPFGRRPEFPVVEEAARRLSTFVANAFAGTPTHYTFALHGTPGTGKSHLCLRAALKASEVPVSVVYTTGTALAEKFKDFGFKDASDSSKREAHDRRSLAMSDLITARLVVLDEIDHISSDWTNDQLLEVLNKRRSRNLATLLSGNNLYLLGRESDRAHSISPVVSRLRGREGIWMDFSGVADARGLTFASPKECAS